MLEDYSDVIAWHRVFVAEDRGRIVGLVVLIAEGEHALLDNVAIHPDAQGRGLGRRLIRLAEDEARRLGFSAIELYTHELMTENQALYARLGYREFDRREEKGYRRVYLRKSLELSE